jgi:hypothetical protein
MEVMAFEEAFSKAGYVHTYVYVGMQVYICIYTYVGSRSQMYSSFFVFSFFRFPWFI